jgi:hypothetical protein
LPTIDLELGEAAKHEREVWYDDVEVYKAPSLEGRKASPFFLSLWQALSSESLPQTEEYYFS